MVPREIIGPQDRFERTGAESLRDIRPITTKLWEGLMSEVSGVILGVAAIRCSSSRRRSICSSRLPWLMRRWC